MLDDAIEEIEVRPPEFSDDNLALRFTLSNIERVRYVARWGRWYLWERRAPSSPSGTQSLKNVSMSSWLNLKACPG
jgi:hypothetical protein